MYIWKPHKRSLLPLLTLIYIFILWVYNEAMNEVPRPDATGALAKLSRLKRRPSASGTGTQGFQRLPSDNAPALRLGDRGAGFNLLGQTETHAPGFATLSTNSATGEPSAAPNPQTAGTSLDQPAGQAREPKRRRQRGKKPQAASQPDGTGDPGGRAEQQQQNDQAQAQDQDQTPDNAASGGNRPPGGGDKGKTDFAEPDPEDNDRRKGAGEHEIVDLSAKSNGNAASKNPATGEPARRARNEDIEEAGRRPENKADSVAGSGTRRPESDDLVEDEVIGEIIVELDEPDKKTGSHAQQASGTEALREMRNHREALGLPAERLEDDPRWREAFHEAFVPPDVPDGDPAAMPREKINAWFETRNARALKAAAVADAALPQQDIYAYHQYGRPHENPETDPAVRIMLHLDDPRGVRTPEGDPTVKDTLVVDPATGETRVKRRPTLEELNQPDVTVSPDDIARFRELFPHKAAVYADYLAELDAQQIHEVQVYPKYAAKPKQRVKWVQDRANPAARVPILVPETEFVPDPVLTQMRDAWENENPGARPAQVVNPQPEAKKERGIRKAAYLQATEHYTRRARQKLHPTAVGRKLYYDHATGKWKAKEGKNPRSELWQDMQAVYRDEILLHDAKKYEASRPTPTTNQLYERTGRTGYRRGVGGGFRRTRPRHLHRDVDSVSVGRKVENRIRNLRLKSDEDISARDVLRARKTVRHAKRAQRTFRAEALNEAHETIFPKSPHTAQRPHQREGFQGDPRRTPAWETRQQRNARRRVRNMVRVQEFQANQRRYHAANGRVLDLEGQENKIKERMKETSVFQFITLGRLHSQLVNLHHELRHARAEAFMYHPAIRAITKGINIAGGRFGLAA
jgi:hypothetical protein